MPKVSRTELIIDGVRRDYDIYYKGGEGFSLKGLPSELCALAEFRPSGFSTEGALVEAAHAANRLYRLRKTQSKLVIVYRCSASSALRMNRISDGNYSGILPGVSRNISDTRYGGLAAIDIDFKVVQRIDDGNRPIYRKVNQDTLEVTTHDVSLDSEYLQMDYTPERHEFFKQIVVAMRQMIVGVSSFFGAEPEDAVKFIDNKVKLLNQWTTQTLTCKLL